MRRSYKFLALPWQEKRLYLSATLWLLAAKAGLYLLSFEHLQHLVTRLGEPNGRRATVQDMQMIVLAIQRIGRFLSPLQINCLPQALVGYMMLHRRGFAGIEIKIGVCKDFQQKLAAHAWLEYEGRVLIGDLHNLEEFRPFSSVSL